MRRLPILLVFCFLAHAPALAAAPSALEQGHMEVFGLPGGLLVAAPHGGFDRFTEEMARQVALLAGGGYLLASGYRTAERPWNVNRPTQGVGLKAAVEQESPGAADVYTAYEGHVRRLAPRLYVELHGNSRAASAGWVEVAAQGLTNAEASWLKVEFARRVAMLPDGLPRLGMRIEGLDALHYRAMGVKTRGVLRHVPRALHFELPWAVRAEPTVRSRYATTIALTLAAFETQAR